MNTQPEHTEYPPGTSFERTAWVLPKRDGPWVVVRRQNADRSLGWHTWHFSRWGARRAARRFTETGKTRGFKP